MRVNRDRPMPSVPIPPRIRRPLSPIRDSASFAALAEATAPISFSNFYTEVTSPKSPLRAFISGDVRNIACYTSPYREYLLMCVHVIQDEGVPIVWLRAEQGSTVPATIQFSTSRSNLSGVCDYDIIATTFATLNFRHVIDLLNDVVTTTGMESRWWVGITIGMLHGGFGGSWLKPPSPDWFKITLNFSTKLIAATESVERRFAIRHPHIKRIPFGDPKAWENKPASLSQPPSSKQDGCEGADSKLAGMKEKIAHISSAPTLSQEHLQASRPMQSPKANDAVPAAGTDVEDGGDQPRGREINHSHVLASKPVESPMPYDPHRRSISRTRNPLFGQIDERRPVQLANPSSTPTPISTGIDEAASILQGVMITTPSAEASRQSPQASLPFTNPQPSLTETPNLTGHIVRLGSAPMARGGCSSVWRGTLLSTTSDNPHQTLQVALKVLHASYTDDSTVKRKLRKHLHIEMRIWAQLRHENVVRLLGHTEEPDGPGLVSISYLHGDVLSFLAKNPSVNREIICADVALGLRYLHEHKPPIIHGDLKGRNVLIDAEGRASICDFGLSIILDGEPTGYTSSNFGGTLRFLAPELLDERTRTVQTDIYAYACTCIQILFDLGPYHLLSEEAPLIRAILDPRRPPFEPSDEEVTFPSVLQVLKHCWSHDRWSRPSVNLVIDTLQRCLYRTYQTNLGVHQGIGKRVRFTSLPDVGQGKLMWVDEDGLSIVVKSSTSFHQVPIYQHYRWELMENQNVEDSEDDTNPSSFLSGKDASSSESPPHVSKWMDYSVKFRLPYSSMVSYESYHKASP